MRRFKKNKSKDMTPGVPLRAAVFCAVSLMLGVTAMAIAVAMTFRSEAEEKRSAEMMGRLAFGDAEERITAAAEALRQVGAEGIEASRRAELLADALDGLSGAKAALTRAGAGEIPGGTAELVNYCRAAILSALREGNGADISQLWKTVEELRVALADSDPEQALKRLAEGGGNVMAENAEKDEDYDRGYAYFRTAPELTRDALRAKAQAYFSARAVLDTVGGSGFPPAIVLCGENLYVSVSASRGELLELYFDRPPGQAKLSERQCAEAAVSFLRGEGISAAISSEASVRADELCGAFFYRLADRPDDRSDGVEIGVRWDTGRVCYFNAYGYYK